VTRPLIVKLGAALPEASARRAGDFEDWIAEGMGLARAAVDVVAPYLGETLPDPGAPAAVVLTGSAEMVSARLAWSERSAAWLARAVAAGRPVLGICYGHQLLAHALGGRVGPNPRGREMGTATLRPLPDAQRDALFGVLDGPIAAQQSHLESVLELPPGARRLAENAHDANQAFAVGARAWGVQFHPEFDAAVMLGYCDARADLLRDEGLDPEQLAREVREAPAGPRLLQRFAALLRG